MTRDEITDLLEELINAYPYYMKNITEPDRMVDTWEREFGAYDAGTIFKAARHHINISRYFPAISDIKDAINKGQMIYGEQPQPSAPAIEAPKAPAVKIDPTVSFCDLCGLCDQKIQELCEF